MQTYILHCAVKHYAMICAIMLSCSLSTNAAVPINDLMPPGMGNFIFKDELGNSKKPISVYYYVPKAATPESPILFVMSGTNRTAENYRKYWIGHADKYNFVLICPEFSKKYYPYGHQYHRGNVLGQYGEKIPKCKWTFSAIEHLFDYIKKRTMFNKMSTYYIYGHSAGSQFVHRMLLNMPEARIERAVAANAGYYTMPDWEIAYPHGLKSLSVDAASLKCSYAKELTILLGEKDNDSKQKYLPTSSESMAQGKHRLERGRKFYELSKIEAKKLRATFAWRIDTVPGVGHSNRGMSGKAAAILFRKQ
jgi:poly(3-hydroxybutyrate) depolymerase